MALPTLNPPTPLLLRAEPLTPASFIPFGKAITSPLPPSISSIPIPPPKPLNPLHHAHPVVANQSTALKYSPISPMINNYPAQSSPQMSMFSCFPRRSLANGIFDVNILERHPYTTQTFTPLGLSPSDPNTIYLVIVAPSQPQPTSPTPGDEVPNPPDLARARAFVAHGGQAVTYAAGTWHAPMVVLGERRVDFVVTQFVSGVAEEDCQEVRVGDGGLGVRVGELGFGLDHGLWKKEGTSSRSKL